MIGFTPCSPACLKSWIAPASEPWSVSPTAGISSSAARAASAGMRQAPSRIEYSEWTWRWTKGASGTEGQCTTRSCRPLLRDQLRLGGGRCQPAVGGHEVASSASASATPTASDPKSGLFGTKTCPQQTIRERVHPRRCTDRHLIRCLTPGTVRDGRHREQKGRRAVLRKSSDPSLVALRRLAEARSYSAAQTWRAM